MALQISMKLFSNSPAMSFGERLPEEHRRGVREQLRACLSWQLKTMYNRVSRVSLLSFKEAIVAKTFPRRRSEISGTTWRSVCRRQESELSTP